ncbi:MAG: hypothetical protein ACR2KB_05875 [Chitinophagaceae bacterium]
MQGRFYNRCSSKIICGQDAFCDESGNISNDIPGMHWKVAFSLTATGIKVEAEITFASEADLEKIVEMGLKEGFTAAHDNLDELLESKCIDQSGNLLWQKPVRHGSLF